MTPNERSRTRFPLRVAVAALFGLLLLAACGPEGESRLPAPDEIPPPAPIGTDDTSVGGVAAQITQYLLGPGDRLTVTVFGQPDMSGEFEVDGSGQLTLPLVGAVDAGGLTVTGLTESLTTRLASDFLVDPQVSIEVLNYRPFYILGEVKSPGSYAYVAGIDVRQSIAIAGGFTRRAWTTDVTIVREARDGRRKFVASIDAIVLPGDTIVITRRVF
ncbi:MAG: polysaccharide export protein [Rhodospirillaceae bacterium]|nr:polysaccharide export protein [Rhodospirillaceae bacterium]MBT6116536.1 polysaccharide export protein [Rhodospirillaceae bacterium]